MSHPYTLVDHDGTLLAWADAWPGILCGAANREVLEVALPKAAADYRSWLNRHGIEGPAAGPWTVSNEVPSAGGLTGGDPIYLSDRQTLSASEFERFLEHVRAAQADLRDTANMPDVLLDWIPPAVTVQRIDPWAPDPRSARGILVHALQLEVFYREGLRDGPAAGIFERVRTAEVEHSATVEILRAAALSDPDQVYRPQRIQRPNAAPEPAGEWTIRKVIRRLISHDRQHAAEITERRISSQSGGSGRAPST
ncbi:MAG: hypothetical protein AB7N24_05870 [Dehalococcoidia bacterium]